MLLADVVNYVQKVHYLLHDVLLLSCSTALRTCATHALGGALMSSDLTQPI